MSFKFVASAAAVILASNSGHAEPGDPVEPAEVSQAMLDALREVTGVPGFGAAVWRDGGLVWTGSTGMRDIERGLPVQGDTRFRLASVSKLFATTSLARLAEDGAVDLDAPVTSQLPWLANDWPAITARQLAAHVSGLPHYQPQDAQRGDIHFSSAREAVGIFSDRPLQSEPGSAYSYSSWGYTLLGAIVEQASQRSFPDYVSQVLVPGLDVGRDATDSADERASGAYELGPDGPKKAAPHDFSYTWAGGGMMASAAGVARFGGAMMQDKIVSKKSFDDMLRPVLLSSGRPAGERDFAVGFGWRTAIDADGQVMAFHNGSAIGARSALVLWREHGVAVSLLSNASWVSSIEEAARMLAAPFRPAPEGLTARACPISASSYSGQLGTIKLAGTARFTMRDGRCEGELSMGEGLRAYYSQSAQAPGETIRVIGIDAGGGLSRAGLVTPHGIFDLRAGEAGRLTASLSRERSFEFVLGE